MQKKRVLVVEDEESLLKLLTVILTVNGYEVFGASTGNEALGKLSDETFDLIILDIMLPDINGYDICRQIKGNSLHANIPVVMLTAKKSAEDRELGSTCGADLYLTKPFKSAVIIEVINKLLSGKATVEINQ